MCLRNDFQICFGHDGTRQPSRIWNRRGFGQRDRTSSMFGNDATQPNRRLNQADKPLGQHDPTTPSFQWHYVHVYPTTPSSLNNNLLVFL